MENCNMEPQEPRYKGYPFAPEPTKFYAYNYEYDKYPMPTIGIRPFIRDKKVLPNDPCSCGSGIKFKKRNK